MRVHHIEKKKKRASARARRPRRIAPTHLIEPLASAICDLMCVGLDVKRKRAGTGKVARLATSSSEAASEQLFRAARTDTSWLQGKST